VNHIVSRRVLYNQAFQQKNLYNTADTKELETFIILEENDDAKKAFSIIDWPIVVADQDGKFKGILDKNKLIKDYYRRKEYITKELIAILDSAYSGIVAINKNEQIIACNHSAEQILEVSIKECIGKNVYDVFPVSNLPRVLKTAEKRLGETANYRGKQLMINQTPIIKDDEVIGAVATFHDITDFKEVAQELKDEKHSSRILRTILDNVYDGLIVVDESGYISMINEPYAQFLGMPIENIVGRHVTEVIDNTRLHIVIKTGKEEIGEIQRINNRNIVVMRIPIYKEEKVIGAIGKIMFMDVTELHVLASKIEHDACESKYYKNTLKEANDTKYTFDNIIGVSEKLKETKYLAEKVACTNSNVLIRGESGTGKELFAHAIHAASSRAMGPFIKVNCAAIPSELLESELFGYEEGAFTGAKRGGKVGKFEMANSGSIFLDEIGDMPHNMQAKLLRVLQDKEIERVGGTKNISLDVRIITATNRNLEKMIEEGKYREDLYYRLNVINIHIPPLRERPEDLKPLVQYLLTKLSKEVGNYVTKISSQAMKYLEGYTWPGNVRELENVLERAINLIDYGKEIQINHLPRHIRKTQFSFKNIENGGLKKVLDEVEKQVILDCLKKTGDNRTETAKILDISRSSLYEKLWKYGIE
jgi:PAS domain S-box-containing protein